MSTVKTNAIEPASGGTVAITGAALTTPALGTPASGTLTNCTGLPASTGLSGTTLASNVVNASINAITPSGGTLSVTGAGSFNPKSARLAVGGDLVIHGGNTRTTAKYTGTSGTSSTWADVVDLATLQTGGGHFAARVRCYGYENGFANTSYCEYYVLYSNAGWAISPISTKLVGVGSNAYGDITLRVSGSTLQAQNGAPGVGGYSISIDIFEIA